MAFFFNRKEVKVKHFIRTPDQRALDQEPEFNRFVEAAMSRRRFLKATGAAGTAGFFCCESYWSGCC